MNPNLTFPQGPITDEKGALSLEWFMWLQNMAKQMQLLSDLLSQNSIAQFIPPQSGEDGDEGPPGPPGNAGVDGNPGLNGVPIPGQDGEDALVGFTGFPSQAAYAFDGTTLTTGNLSTGNLSFTGNGTFGDAAADTITFNAGTWTLANSYVATLAAGTVAAGTSSSQENDVTFTANAAGNTTLRGSFYTLTSAGGNAFTQAVTTRAEAIHGGTALAGSLISVLGILRVTNSGNVTTGDVFRAPSPGFTSTGAVVSLTAFHAQNQGNATLVTNGRGFLCDNFTACATLTAGYESQMTSGTGKWGFYASGSADNAFSGNVRIGSTTAPSVPLDVTGDINGSTNFTAWTSFTTTRTGWTDVGAPTVTARYCQVRNVVFFQVKVVPATTTATVAGTSYVSLPTSAGGSSIGGDGSMMNITTLVGVGNVVIDTTNSRCYVPTQGATANTLTISGWYEA